MSSTNVMRNRIASELNRSLSDPFGNSGETFATAVNREINSAISHYSSQRFRWNEVRESEFATTSDGTRVYSLPANFVWFDSLKLLYNTSFITMEKRSWKEIDEKDRDSSSNTGVPDEYAMFGNVIRPYPIPNGSYTLYASYIKAELPTSVTGSYTAVIPSWGSYSLTVTTTASHNSRTNGWFQEGEELIRARAIAALEINYLRNPRAISEAQGIALNRQPYLSVREGNAFQSLQDKSFDALTTGRIRPYFI